MKRSLSLVVVVGMLSAVTPAAAAQPIDQPTERNLPDTVAAMRLDAPLSAAGGLPETDQPTGTVAVVVHLSEPAVAASPNADSATEVRRLERRQTALVERLAGRYGAEEIARVQIVLNAVFIEVSAEALPAIVREAGVRRVVPVAHYEAALSETVPLIGATDVQTAGLDGSGVRVAVLDSGIDYTHAALGGPGTTEAYAAAYGDDPADPRNTTRDGLFPTGRVVGGFDFVGEVWPNGEGGFAPDDLAFDSDPIDFGGHGTHVADIIGGADGVAPAADLYAVKVCSAVATSCNGISLILGLEFAVDPNSDGILNDRVDIINMSLGSVYGQPFDDDLALAVDNATAAGVLTVASAGNGADKPYVIGTPSAAPTALAVAQTYVPSASVQGIDIIEPAPGQVGAVLQDWSAPLSDPIGPAPVSFVGLACSLGDDPNSIADSDAPFQPGQLDGQVVLLNRGECNFSVKVFNAQRGGALAAVIGLVGPGEPFSGAFGAGGPFTIPGYMVGQGSAAALVDTTVVISPESATAAAGNVVGSSSRGPSSAFQMIKPEIGAPGASISAVAGSGTDVEAFGGTSGAAPMVSGSAALLLQSRPGLAPGEIKALLMNTGDPALGNSAFTSVPAPISRLGGGEVRVDRAVSSPVAAWDDGSGQGALSFGSFEVARSLALTRTVRVRNYGAAPRTLAITPEFRFGDDERSRAVTFYVPDQVTVPAGEDVTFDVTMQIMPDLLAGNFMNSGAEGSSGAALTLNEIDGFLTLDDGSTPVRLPWHVLPRQAAEVVPTSSTFTPGPVPDVIGLDNRGAGTAQNDAYSLLALSPDLPEGIRGRQSPAPDLRAFGVNTFTAPAGFCSPDPSFVWAFAISTWEPQSHLVPVSHIVEMDVDRDGFVDFVVVNRDASSEPPSFNTVGDGRQLTWVIGETTASAFFFAEHATNTGNTVLYLCAEQLGLSANDLLATPVDVRVTTQDFYFGGPSDRSDIFTITPLGEQYFGLANDVPGSAFDPGGLGILDFGPFPGNSPELGVLLFTNGDRGPGARGGATDDSEALVFTTTLPAITGFVLVDADTDTDVRGQDALVGLGSVIDTAVTPRFNIRAETSDQTVGSIAVEIADLDGRPVHFRRDRRSWENFFPFAVGGDWPVGKYQPMELSAGTYTLRATPYSGGSLNGTQGATTEVTFTVIDGG